MYGAALFNTAVRMLGNTQDAEDAVQEVFTAIVRSRGTLHQVVNLKAYLFTSLRNAAGRIYQRRQKLALTGLEAEHCPTSRPTDQQAQAEGLWKMVSRLPLEQQEVLALKIHGELTFREIGKMYGISPHTAASRYRYALQKLKKLLETNRC
jgi:RNA polymerase sigma-70 factor (ECF subfamily)